MMLRRSRSKQSEGPSDPERSEGPVFDMGEWHVYIAECKDGKLYTGIAKDVKTRIQRHNEGRGSRFTKYRRPLKLLYIEEHPNKSSALKRELYIKGLTRAKKIALIENN